MSFRTDLDHCKLEAIFTTGGEEVETVAHYEYISNSALGIRKARVEKRWLRRGRLGRGSFGDVWLEEREDQPDVKRAVKEIRQEMVRGMGADWVKELSTLIEFSKTKYRQEGLFVEFLGWFDNIKTDTVFLAMEYFPLGDLSTHMSSSFSSFSIKEIAMQILQALRAMHGEGYAHRDLKPANIFVVQTSPNWWIKLGDFGISKRIENSETNLRTWVGTRDYMAPEFFGYVDDEEMDEESSAYTNAVDLWALGCIIYKLYTHQVPFATRDSPMPLKRYSMGIRPFPKELLKENGVGKDSVEFLMRLLEPRPARRLTAQEALDAAWLNSVDGEVAEVDVLPLLRSQREAISDGTMVKNYKPMQAPAPSKEEKKISVPRWPMLGPWWDGVEPVTTWERPRSPTEAERRLMSGEEDPKKSRNLYLEALTVRMPALTPHLPPYPIDCPLAMNCHLKGRQYGFKTQEELDKHLPAVHGDWEETMRDYKETGRLEHLNDVKEPKPLDCPMKCEREWRNGFDTAEEVREHLRVHHEQKNVEEGDLLVPIVKMGILY